MTCPEPFTPTTTPAVLEDLGTRRPHAPEDAGWSLGTDVDHLRCPAGVAG